jgi:hypothetical protein
MMAWTKARIDAEPYRFALGTGGFIINFSSRFAFGGGEGRKGSRARMTRL